MYNGFYSSYSYVMNGMEFASETEAKEYFEKENEDYYEKSSKKFSLLNLFQKETGLHLYHDVGKERYIVTNSFSDKECKKRIKKFNEVHGTRITSVYNYNEDSTTVLI